MKKYVYLVRHGESESNAGLAGLGDPILTEKGREQAKIIADRCSRLPIDLIISSTMKRAIETAEFIQEKVQKPLEISELFVERRPPSECIGMKEEEYRKILDLNNKNLADPDYIYSDEENFANLNARAAKVIDFLSRKKEEHIVVVTHGAFMKLIVGRVLFGNLFTPHICVAMLDGLRTHNTGLTIIRYDDSDKMWEVMTWNDYAHLG